MAQHQVSDGDKYALSRDALPRAWMAFALVVLVAALAVGIFRTGVYRTAIDAARSAINAAGSRSPVSALQHESPMLVREGARISVPEGSPLRGKLTVAAVTEKEVQRTLAL